MNSRFIGKAPRYSEAGWRRIRLGLVAVVLGVAASSVIARAAQVQLRQSPKLQRLALQQHSRSIELAPMRGTISDRHGAALAVSAETESLWANPRAFQRSGADIEAVAQKLAAILDVSVGTLRRRLASRRYFVWLQRQLAPQVATRVRKLGLPGLRLTPEARRFYPNGSLAAHVLGFAGIDGVGLEGIEHRFDERLRGRREAVSTLRDRRGRVVFSPHFFDDRLLRGDDLVLTLDKSLQHLAERELGLGVRSFEAKAGSLVAVDPRTGDILALCSAPTYDLNRPGAAPPENRRARAFTDHFEPGSTVKPLVLGAALHRGALSQDEVIDCESGQFAIGGTVIHDTRPHGLLGPAEILAVSSNIGMAKIAARLGAEGVHNALQQAGLGKRTGLPCPGESAGMLRPARQWMELDTASAAFGQGIGVTAIQLAMAFAAVGYDGNLRRPRLIRAWHDADESTVPVQPQVVRRLMRAEEAAELRRMMRAVTEADGSGKLAAIAGYRVAGKTGTAQKARLDGRGYDANRRVASFVGMVPAEAPRIVVVVVVDEPQVARSGGQVAAPIFRRFARSALRHLGVAVQASAGAEPGEQDTAKPEAGR